MTIGSVIYSSFANIILSPGANLISANVGCALVSTTTGNTGNNYTYSNSHQFASSIPTGSILSTTTLSSKAVANGAFNSGNIVFTSVVQKGAQAGQALIFYIATNSTSTTQLISYSDIINSNSFSVLPNGGNITATVGASILTVSTPATYSVIPDITSVNEGDSVVFTVSTTNVPDASTYYWSLTSGSTANAIWFADGQTSGSFTINSNTATITRTISYGLSSEITENFALQVMTGSTSGTVVPNGTSSVVTIVTPPAVTFLSSGTNLGVNGHKLYDQYNNEFIIKAASWVGTDSVFRPNGLESRNYKNVIIPGTVSVTNGNATVTGSGTAWNETVGVLPQLTVGQSILIGGTAPSNAYTIATITSNTVLTLTTPYAGVTASSLVVTKEGLLEEFKRAGFNTLRYMICEDITWNRSIMATPHNWDPASPSYALQPDVRLQDGAYGTKPNATLNYIDFFNNQDLFESGHTAIDTCTYTMPQCTLPVLQIVDRIVAHCYTIGLRVMFDLHCLAPNTDNNASTGGLWYTTLYPSAPVSPSISIGNDRNEQQALDCLTLLAYRYAGNPAVCGFDLINEPYNGTWDINNNLGSQPAWRPAFGSAFSGVSAPAGTWYVGQATGQSFTNSSLVSFYNRCSVAIHAVNPGVMLICEGPARYQEARQQSIVPGTVTVINGSNVVTGTGTYFNGSTGNVVAVALTPGTTVAIWNSDKTTVASAATYTIASVNNNTQAILSSNYSGANATGMYLYRPDGAWFSTGSTDFTPVGSGTTGPAGYQYSTDSTTGQWNWGVTYAAALNSVAIVNNIPADTQTQHKYVVTTATALQNKVIYSPHEYPYTVQSFNRQWFTYLASAPYNLTTLPTNYTAQGGLQWPLNMPEVWRRQWGYLAEQKLYPVFIGELSSQFAYYNATAAGVTPGSLGTQLNYAEDIGWINQMGAYCATNSISYAWFAFNATNGVEPGDGNTGGIFRFNGNTIPGGGITVAAQQYKLSIIQTAGLITPLT